MSEAGAVNFRTRAARSFSGRLTRVVMGLSSKFRPESAGVN